MTTEIQTRARKYVNDIKLSSDITIVKFVSMQVTNKIHNLLTNRDSDGQKTYYSFNRGVSELVVQKTKLENVISSLRDFVEQKKELLTNEIALSLLKSLDEFYATFEGNGYQIKLFVFGHFRKMDADFYELRSLLKQISVKEDPYKEFLRVNYFKNKLEITQSLKKVISTVWKPVCFVCGLPLKPLHYVCSLVSGIFWKATPREVFTYHPTILEERIWSLIKNSILFDEDRMIGIDNKKVEKKKFVYEKVYLS